MKKYIVIIVFACCSRLAAQPGNGAAGTLAQGTMVPDVTINKLINYSAASAKFSDFKGKWIILDFWATWCGPCVKMIPRIDSLQREFKSSVQFISVTDQKKSVVESFFDRLENGHSFRLVECVEDTVLSRLFGMAALPHFAWIDPTGKYVAFSSDAVINSASIRSVLNGNPLQGSFQAEAELNYDATQPLFRETNPTNEDSFIFHSILTGYKDGIGGGLYSDITKKDDGTPNRRITARNLTVAALYQIALSDGFKVYGWDKTLLKVKDPTLLNSKLTGVDYDNWLKNGRGYCYEIVVPKENAAIATQYMRRDLEVFFPQYKAAVENLIVKCWALEATGAVNAPTSGATPKADFDLTGFTMVNCNLNVLTRRIAHFLQGYDLPVVNDTNYTPHVDLVVNANLTDIKVINAQLAKYNLQFVQKDLEQEMLVIRDN